MFSLWGNIAQGGYQNRSIFESLDLAWELLRTFPQNLLGKIDPGLREQYYPRGKTFGRPPYEAPSGHH